MLQIVFEITSELVRLRRSKLDFCCAVAAVDRMSVRLSHVEQLTGLLITHLDNKMVQV